MFSPAQIIRLHDYDERVLDSTAQRDRIIEDESRPYIVGMKKPNGVLRVKLAELLGMASVEEFRRRFS